MDEKAPEKAAEALRVDIKLRTDESTPGTDLTHVARPEQEETCTAAPVNAEPPSDSRSKLLSYLPDARERAISFAKRTLANIIDQTICLTAAMMSALPAAIALNYLFWQAPLQLPAWLLGLLTVISLACAIIGGRFWWLVYSVRFECSPWQATPGKALLGLTVTNKDGEKIARSSAYKRLFSQYLLVSLLTFCGLTLYRVIEANWQSNDLLQVLLPLLPVICCFLTALFSERGQTVFDFLCQRVVEDQDWKPAHSLNKPRLKKGAKEALKLLFTNSRGHHDWALTLTTVWSLLAGSATVLITAAVVLAFTQLDQLSLSSDFQNDPHYIKTRAFFRDPGLLYYYRAEIMNDSFFGKTANLERAARLSPTDWCIHNALANALVSQNQIERAAEELKLSIDLRRKENNVILEGPVKISVEKAIGKSETLKIDQQYLKLGLLLTRLKDYQEALGALDKALAENPSVEKYRARAAVWKALGNTDKAGADLAAAKSSISVETDIGTVTFGR